MTDQVAVTGAEGFIGSHLVEALVSRGHRVRAMVLYNMHSSHGWLDVLDADVQDQVDVMFGDVRDPASVRQLVEDTAAVYHLAALGSVPYSYSAPRSFVDTNVIGTLHVLEAVRDLPDSAPGAHLDQRDLRHRPQRADQRGARAAGAVAVRGVQDRGRQAGRVLLPQLRDARGHAAAVQHVRPPAVGPRRHPGDHHPARRRFPPAQARRARPDPGLLVRDRHGRGVRGPWRGAGVGGARRSLQRRAGCRRGDRPAGRGHRRPDGCGGRHRRGFAAAASRRIPR